MNLTYFPALSSTLSSPGKRKAESFESDDDSENIDPIIFNSPKRARAPDGTNKDKESLSKPTNFFLTKAPPSPTDLSLSSPLKPTKPFSSHRSILQPRSQTPKVSTSLPKSSPVSAPAGRSPTRKRVGILNRRRTGSPITRINPPPKFSTATPSGLSFSIDAALSGSIPSYGARQRQTSSSLTSTPASSLIPKSQTNDLPALHVSESKSSWFFQIHEDTEDELATNLMEHSTCTLDISSDEEYASRLRDRQDKENIPPSDDISQTRVAISSSFPNSSIREAEIRGLKMKTKMQRRKEMELMEDKIEIDRCPLGEMNKEDFYADGCDERSVWIVLPEVEEETEGLDTTYAEKSEFVKPMPPPPTLASTDVKGKGKVIDMNIDYLMQKKIVEPIEKPEEDFVVWESGSAKDEAEGEQDLGQD